jgi:hypothetical protein
MGQTSIEKLQRAFLEPIRKELTRRERSDIIEKQSKKKGERRWDTQRI